MQHTIDTSQYKAAIFDMDGTMIENMAYHKKAWQEFLRRHDIHLGDEEFQKRISGKKNDQIFEIVFGQKLSGDEIKRYTHEKEAIYRELYKSDIKEVGGLTRFVDQLARAGVKLAIATTAPKDNRNFALESLALEGRFEVILGDEHVTNGKPHPEIYLSTAKMLGVEPRECIVFEDSLPGVESGKAAGMTVVALLTSHGENELSQADSVINDFSEVAVQ